MSGKSFHRLAAARKRKKKDGAAGHRGRRARGGGGNRRRSVVRHRRWALLLALASAAAAVAAVALFYAGWASRFDLGLVAAIPERSAVYDCRGRPYSRLAGENRLVVAFDEIAPVFFDALLAREDTRFFHHCGLDFRGIARAAAKNLLHRGVREGGSTLSQQLALNTFLGGRHVRSLNRKLLEAFLALRIEENFNKRQILEFYANRIYFGAGMYGVETASRTYFGKAAAALELPEAALLVGLIRSPNRFSPLRDPAAAMAQRDAVLKRLVDLGSISAAAAAAASRAPTAIVGGRALAAQENYAVDAVRQELGLILDRDHWDEGGLRIHTTIDPDLQRAAEEAVAKRLREIESRPGYPHPTMAGTPADGGDRSTPYLQCALVAIDNRTGGIRAVVGGRDYAASRYNRAWLAKRQVGSTFKPFVYAAAIAGGMDPGTPIDDGPLRPGDVRGAPDWAPANADGQSLGRQPAAEGLIQSRNTMTVRVGQRAGLRTVRRLAAAAGLPDLPPQAGIYLGACEASVRDMTAAYTVFPNDGVRRQPYLIERIEDADGVVLYRAAHLNARTMAADVAKAVTAMLVQAVKRGTGKPVQDMGIAGAVAGKTGTTDGFRDAWFVGFSRSLTCGVWVGLDTPERILPGGYGAVLALPVWGEFMAKVPAPRYPAGALGGGDEAVPRPSGEGLGNRLLEPFRHLFERQR